MYINKNKGFSFIEIILMIAIFSIVLQSLYLYLSILNKEKILYSKKMIIKTKSEPIFMKIQNSIYGSLNYKIYENFRLPSQIDYSFESKESGNILIIEKYSLIGLENYREAEIYHFNEGFINSAKGKIFSKDILLVEIDNIENVLNKINCKVFLEEYGISIRGNFLNEKFEKEIKK
ncbi:hypothetical protein H5J22_06655 [Cetobacterium sp. 8H]|uniref:hypothetical protein n=1 Tax=Cetobacterium sp. 8H TaxID=2759681 RepID=UPI00163BD31E|nr:hypothetical protein [Cetobacterium sp. 8H]MBC2851093.1 hypothetical protein [Cetobacterium sp. 8H]